jgi:glutaredoxin
MTQKLILYSKPGCHLCEGLQEKLTEIQSSLNFELEVRDITLRDDWFEAYQYEVPVLCQQKEGQEKLISRPSPRLSVRQLEKYLQEQGIIGARDFR